MTAVTSTSTTTNNTIRNNSNSNSTSWKSTRHDPLHTVHAGHADVDGVEIDIYHGSDQKRRRPRGNDGTHCQHHRHHQGDGDGTRASDEKADVLESMPASKSFPASEADGSLRSAVGVTLQQHGEQDGEKEEDHDHDHDHEIDANGNGDVDTDSSTHPSATKKQKRNHYRVHASSMDHHDNDDDNDDDQQQQQHLQVPHLDLHQLDETKGEYQQQQHQQQDVIRIDIDSILMPPPPPQPKQHTSVIASPPASNGAKTTRARTRTRTRSRMRPRSNAIDLTHELSSLAPPLPVSSMPSKNHMNPIAEVTSPCSVHIHSNTNTNSTSDTTTSSSSDSHSHSDHASCTSMEYIHMMTEEAMSTSFEIARHIDLQMQLQNANPNADDTSTNAHDHDHHPMHPHDSHHAPLAGSLPASAAADDADSATASTPASSSALRLSPNIHRSASSHYLDLLQTIHEHDDREQEQEHPTDMDPDTDADANTAAAPVHDNGSLSPSPSSTSRSSMDDRSHANMSMERNNQEEEEEEEEEEEANADVGMDSNEHHKHENVAHNHHHHGHLHLDHVQEAHAHTHPNPLDQETCDGDDSVPCHDSGEDQDAEGVGAGAIVSYDKPTITTRFSDIIGHGAAKLRLDEMLLPLALPASLSRNILTGVRAVAASILLYGPPGCGKTKLAKAVAGEAQAAFLSIGPSDVLSKFVGESEASIKQLFEQAKHMADRMESRCCVLFFDEIDALGVSRGGQGCGNGGAGKENGGGGGSENSSRRILAELLIQLTSLAEDMDLKSDEDHLDMDDVHAHVGDPNMRGKDSDGGECERGKDRTCTDLPNNRGECNGNRGRNEERDRGNGPPPPRPISPSSDKDDNHDSNGKSTATSDKNANVNIKPRIIVIAATNRPEDCDPALLRRFAIRVLVGLPSQRDRKKIIARLLEEIDHTLTNTQLKELSRETDGWSGSDLESVTREAVMAPIRECLRSAAITKMKMRKNKNKKHSQVEVANEKARDELLNRFRRLRPVTMQDFQEAIEFWTCGGGQDQMTAQMMSEASICHYDSDSSSEDLEE